MEKINKNSFKKFLDKIDACKYEGTGRIRLDVSLALGMLGIARPYWRISDHLKGFENFGIEYQESEHLFIFKNFEHLQELREIAQEYFRELETKQPDTNVDSLQKSEDQFLEIVKNVIDERVNGILEKILNDSFPESSQTIENIFKSRDR